MKIIILACALVAACTAIVCPPDACANVERPALNCRGPIVKGSGFCGCTDSCAKLEGEACEISKFGVPNENQCDEGLACQRTTRGDMFEQICVKKEPIDEVFSIGNRIVCTDDMCDGVELEALNCAGAVHSVGFCGCKKVCAKQAGESCVLDTALPVLLGMPAKEGKCDEGLECRDLNLEGHSTPVCVDPASDGDEVFLSKRDGLLVCPDNACANVVKEDLNCKGGLLQGTGWCGCTDTCAKVHGEKCVRHDDPFLLMDVPNTEACDEGLVCHKAYEGSHALCLKPEEVDSFVSKRSS